MAEGDVSRVAARLEDQLSKFPAELLDRPCVESHLGKLVHDIDTCLLYTSPSPRDATLSRMPSSA